MSASETSALKEIFDARQFRHIARETAAVHPRFDTKRFLKLSLQGLEPLSLMQRVRRTSESLHATLPSDYREAIAVLSTLRQFAHGVRPRHPPLRPFTARLKKLQHAIRLRPAKVKRNAPSSDDRPGAVMHLFARFVLIKTEMNEAAQEIAGL